jgi:signal transduction histidine kinase
MILRKIFRLKSSRLNRSRLKSSRLKSSQWLLAGFGLAVLWLGLSTALSYRNTERIVNSTEQSLQSYEILKNLADVSTSMTVAESGRRGYIFLNDRHELERYHNAVDQLGTELATLQTQLQPNPPQRARLEQLRRLMQQRLALLRQSVLLYNQQPQVTAQQITITQQSVALREQIQQQLQQLEAIEEESLKQGLSISADSIRKRTAIEGWLMASMLATLALGLIALSRQVARRYQAETQQRQLAQQTELNEMKLRFFSMVSHEFRTPLTVILGSTQLILAQRAPSSSQFTHGHSLQRIQSAAKSMIQLLNDMLTLTRADAGKLEYHPRSVELVAFCLNLIEDINLARAEGEDRSAIDPRIQFRNQATLNHATLDEKLLYSLLSNLLANALKYDPTQQPVHLELAGDQQWVEFTITDRGMGISAEEQLHLYEPFYRGENVRSISGTGLGLAVVKKCVDLHQGEIGVESQAGQGTTFRIKLPRQPTTNK